MLKFIYQNEVKWQISDVVKLITLVFLFGYLISVFLHFFLSIFSINLYPNLKPIISAVIVNGLVLFFVHYFVFKKYRQNIASLGINFKHFFKKIKLGIITYITITPILVLLIIFLGILARQLNYQPPTHPLIDIILDEKNAFFLFFLFLLGGIIGPIVEEIFFRGFAYSAIKKKIGVPLSIVITASFFAALHQNLFAFLPIFFLGAVLAYVYEKSGSLIPSITIHILHNSLMIGGVFFVKGVSQ